MERCFLEKDLDRLWQEYEVERIKTNDHEELTRFLNERLKDVSGIITGWDTPGPLSEELINQAEKLEVLVHSAGSIRRLVPPVVWDRGIRVGTCNGVLAVGVAETTLGMIIAGLKGFFPSRDWTRAGNWQNFPDIKNGMIRELFEVTVGIISASKVGRHLLKLLKQFDVEVLVYDPFFSETEAEEMGVERVSLEELVKRSDVVTLHAPALPETEGMLKEEHFKSMKDRAIFINTARANIVNQDAMIKELQTGRISAFIDVTTPEPVPADHPLRHMENVILTPHLAGNINNGCYRMGRSTVNQLLEYARGEKMHGEVTYQQFIHMA